jgi:succinyl-CoA synthetase beta subunit
MRCDVIATGIVEAARQVKLKLPVVVRLEAPTSIWGARSSPTPASI